jgi:uncharacterized protein
MSIGYIASDKQWQQISPFYEGLFRGMLMLFLLEMGITASRQIKAFRQVGVFMAGFGMLMPVLHGIVGVTLAHGGGCRWAGLSCSAPSAPALRSSMRPRPAAPRCPRPTPAST